MPLAESIDFSLAGRNHAHSQNWLCHTLLGFWYALKSAQPEFIACDPHAMEQSRLCHDLLGFWSAFFFAEADSEKKQDDGGGDGRNHPDGAPVVKRSAGS